MTLAIKETCAGRTGIVDQKSIELDKGSPEDAAAEVDISLYFYYTYIPKVQIMDFWYKDNVIRLINAAFAPTSAIGKKIVKLCLHSCYRGQNSFHFDEIFQRKFKILQTTSNGNFWLYSN